MEYGVKQFAIPVFHTHCDRCELPSFASRICYQCNKPYDATFTHFLNTVLCSICEKDDAKLICVC